MFDPKFLCLVLIFNPERINPIGNNRNIGESKINKDVVTRKHDIEVNQHTVQALLLFPSL